MKDYAYREMYENEINHAWYVATRKLVIKNLSKYLKKDAKILDAGCGTGGTIYLLERAGFGNVVGIDSSRTAIKYCRERGLKNIRLGSINNLPYDPKSFDAVICLDVLYHKGVESNLALSQFKRVLKKEGILYLQEPAFNLLKSRHDLAIDTDHRFTKKEISSMVLKQKFKIIKLSYFNFSFFSLISTKRIMDKFINKESLASDVYPLSKIFNLIVLYVLNTESLLLNRINLPFGLSIICISKK